LNEKIERLQNQVNSLQQKIIELEENQTLKIKKALSELLKQSQPSKTIQQGNSNLKPNMGSYFQENDTKINPNLQQVEEPISKGVSEGSKSPLEPLLGSQQYNIPSNEDKGLNQTNFITLGKISEDEKIEIIQKGFQLQAEGKISLKKYYESTDPNSLFQSKGYSIKYESIRRTKLYQSLKE